MLFIGSSGPDRQRSLDVPSSSAHHQYEGGDMDDEPLYVNARQYHRILKRRIARAREAELRRLSQRKVCPTPAHPHFLFHCPSALSSVSLDYIPRIRRHINDHIFTCFSIHSTDSSFPRFPTSSSSTRFCLPPATVLTPVKTQPRSPASSWSWRSLPHRRGDRFQEVGSSSSRRCQAFGAVSWPW